MSDSERVSTKKGQGEKPTPAQEKAIAALLTTSTLDEAAKSAGVSVATLRRWRGQEAFQRAWRAERSALFQDSTAKLQSATGKAVETLIALLDSDRPEIRIRAAQAILASAYKAAEVERQETERADRQDDDARKRSGEVALIEARVKLIEAELVERKRESQGAGPSVSLIGVRIVEARRPEEEGSGTLPQSGS